MAEPPRPVLMIMHQENSSPGRIGQILSSLGHRLDIRRPRFGDPLPDTLEDYAGVVMFGGPMSANDDHLDFLRRELDWIGVALKEDRPFLGICLGAQMLARHLGAQVSPACCGSVEIGYHSVSSECDTLIGRLPKRVFQWHGEGFELPSGARRLATAHGAFANQALAIEANANALGLQFHPEMTYQMVCRWTTLSEDELKEPGAHSRQRQLRDHLGHGQAVERWLKTFLVRWLRG